MADLIGNEEELKLLRQENETLRNQANLLQKTTRVQEETIGLLREQIGLKDQLLAALQRKTTLLTQRVQEIEGQLRKDNYSGHTPSSSVRFSRPAKSVRKKNNKKHG